MSLIKEIIDHGTSMMQGGERGVIHLVDGTLTARGERLLCELDQRPL